MFRLISLYIFSILLTFSSLPAKAYDLYDNTVVVGEESFWSFWAYTSMLGNTYDNNMLWGHAKLSLSTVNSDNLKMYFGVNKGQGLNFHSNQSAFAAEFYLEFLQYNNILNVGFSSNQFTDFNIKKKRGYIHNFKTPISVCGIPSIDGSYLQYNNAFNVNIQHSLLKYPSATLNINYIPYFQFNLAGSDSYMRSLYKNLSAIDMGVDFYNEFKDVGYGVIGVARAYLKSGLSPKGYDLFISPNIDYLGFGVMGSALYGHINQDDINKSYLLSELGLYYTFQKLKFGVIANYNLLYNLSFEIPKNNHKILGLQFDAEYKVNKKFSLLAAYYNNKLDNLIKAGASVGFNIKL